MCLTQGQGEFQVWASSGFLPVESYGQHLLLSAMMCDDNMHGVLPTGEVHLSLDVQSFYWDVIMWTWMTPIVADLNLQPLWSWYCMAKVPHYKPHVGIEYSVWPKAPIVIALSLYTILHGSSKTCKTFQRFRGYLPGAECKSQTSL